MNCTIMSFTVNETSDQEIHKTKLKLKNQDTSISRKITFSKAAHDINTADKGFGHSRATSSKIYFWLVPTTGG